MPPSAAVLYKHSPRPVHMETLNLKPSVEDVEVDAQLRDEFMHESPRAGVPEPRHMNSRHAGERCGDPAAKPPSVDLFGVQRQGKKTIGCGEGDMDAILMTACLFSVAVATFTFESYNMFSLDLCDQTKPLPIHLPPLSQQSVSASNCTPLYWPNIIFRGSAPYMPSASAIRINAPWFLSLVLSLTIIIISVQPPSRLLQEVPRHRGPLYKYAYIFGPSRSPRAVETVLPFSVFLFIVGLVDFLLSINKTVASCVFGFVPAFSVACFVFTALRSPCLYRPHHNLNSSPTSKSVWRAYQILVVIVVAVVGQIGVSLINICRRFGIRLFCVQPSLAFLPH